VGKIHPASTTITDQLAYGTSVDIRNDIVNTATKIIEDKRRQDSPDAYRSEPPKEDYTLDLETFKEGMLISKDLLSDVKFRGDISPKTEIKDQEDDPNLIHLQKFEAGGLITAPMSSRMSSPFKSNRAYSP